jgi:uncharacterized protein YbbC (DUF1343 family)
MDFRPLSSNFAGEVCHGVQIVLLDRQALEPTELGVELEAALWKLFPKDFNLEGSLPLIGSRAVVESIRVGRDPQRIWYDWQEALEKFKKIRAQYLLYP